MLKIITSKPKTLLKNIKEKIDNNQIRTWDYDKDDDFYHTAEQWSERAFLRPEIEAEGVILKLVWPENSPEERIVSAIYHGRFCEMLCSHFKDSFTSIETVLP